ncbi:MAPEG family protein [Reyranella sp.]|uniref:MAPEG family protein n=1 Tax=Reyranella sp. TaxID=1929291 RepID=UPI003BABA9EB
MIAAQMYLPQVLVLVALSFVTALAILVSRVVDLVRNKRPLSFYEDFDGRGAPPAVLRTTRQLANQFEFPVLFYGLVAIAIAIPVQDSLIAGLAWCYVALRWAHALSHLAFNRLYVRTPIFMVGNVVLLAMWLVLALGVLT